MNKKRMHAEIKVRSALPQDGKQIGQLIYDTVRAVNRRDYSQSQVEAWAPDSQIFSIYDSSFAFVADFEGLIIGFGNLTEEGYLHRFYVHKDFQGQGVGSCLLDALEAQARKLKLEKMTTEASITAKPFFLAKGWELVQEQTVVLRNVAFINYKMQKKLIVSKMKVESDLV